MDTEKSNKNLPSQFLQTDSGKTKSNAIEAPSINLPKGGGAIRGIGEKFAANPVTGTGSMSVPIAMSTGRSGFAPQLSLSYDSGAGNGPFGLGWSLSIPSITRKTDKGLPQYLDAQDSDEFTLSGAEDLVPVYCQNSDGSWVRDKENRFIIHEDEIEGYLVRRYRPRIEGLFARIERWTKIDDPSDVHWRSISKDNILTIYGSDNNSRIVDPEDDNRIFSWLIIETRDDKGNAVIYQYKAEDGLGVEIGKANERNRGERDDPRRTANRYLKSIYYGNRTPLLEITGDLPRFLDKAKIDEQIANADWMFEVIFDYGEHDVEAPKPNDQGEWAYRPDPFSRYRSGFEVRTTRLCQRVLMFHHFEKLETQDYLVRSTDFTYSYEEDPAGANNPVYTFLQAVTQIGYRFKNGGYEKRSLPPVEFEYTQPVVEEVVHEVDDESLANLPVGVDGAAYQWIDLHGEGIPGILTEQGGAWFYKRNLSPIGNHDVEFAAMECVATKPNLPLGRGAAQFMDLAGDGQPDLVMLEVPLSGLYEHDAAEGWQPFRPFTSNLIRDMHDPNLKFIDLDGDGLADVLITEEEAFSWHTSLAEEGYGPEHRVTQMFDEEKGPRIVFADGTQSIYLADLSGDGLTDLVRIRNGEVCYWPNLGYGRFGTKITMDMPKVTVDINNVSAFDNPDQFDQKRIRLADIDGSGTTDIIYLHRDGVRLYFNQSGNSWSKPQQLNVFPHVDDIVSIVPTDLLGNGTACLVWSSPLPGDSGRQMRYVNLMGGQKPHLLVKTVNNLGSETRVQYAPSTKFYLEDKRDGKQWITRLPFPVHVVEKVVTFDHISHNRFVTCYTYHHGYFDGEEREFRGFGMVEQWDTEQLEALLNGDVLSMDDNVTAESYVPRVLTKTWFHTGVYLGRDHISDFFAGQLNLDDQGEYFREPGLTDGEARDLLLLDTIIPPELTLGEGREACRSLKGLMLRQEVYAQDHTDKELYPYTVLEQNFSVRCDQPCGENRHAVFFTHPRETITYHYERNPADPRIQHALTLEVDAYGNVLKEASIGYGRRKTIRVINTQGKLQQVPNQGLNNLSETDQLKQTTSMVTYTENRFTNAIETADSHRNPLPCEAKTFELCGYKPTGAAERFQPSDLVKLDPNTRGCLIHIFLNEVNYEEESKGDKCRRLIEWVRTLYRQNDLTALLPLGELETLALQGESYNLAFTPGLLSKVYQRKQPGQTYEALIPNPVAVLGGKTGDSGGYVQSQTLKAAGSFPKSDGDDFWWTPSGRVYFKNTVDSYDNELDFARKHFFLIRRYCNPFGQNTFVDFDNNDLLMLETRDALENRITVDINDYRVLKPCLVSDPNGNQTQVVFDVLGMVAGTAVMGKPLPETVEGDSLDFFVADLTQEQTNDFFDNIDSHANAQQLLQNATTRIIYDIDRFWRTQKDNPTDKTKWMPSYAATLVRETHASDPLPPKGLNIQISLSYSDGFGREIQKKIQAEPGPVVKNGTDVTPRWVGSGWIVYNNKGNPVRKYEPFFSLTHDYEYNKRVGESQVIFYDPAERTIARLYPNYTYDKVVFDPWQQTTYDVNDTVAPYNDQTGDPHTDHDIKGYTDGYFEAMDTKMKNNWQTWYAQRISGALGTNEENAAIKAEAHADTPTTAYFDVLGRPFLTVARNRVICDGHPLDGNVDEVVTRIGLDVEGNQRAVRDAITAARDMQGNSVEDKLGRIVMKYDYDMLGNRIHQRSMEAGSRWLLNDVSGKPLLSWDSRGHNFVTVYDPLRRPIEQWVRGTSPESDPHTLHRDILVEKIEYGESLPNAEKMNLRTRVYRHCDSAGVSTNAYLDEHDNPVEAFDFKGNLLRNTRRLVSNYIDPPDWQQNPQLDDEVFESSTRYDALNRPIQLIGPHSNIARTKLNIIQYVFNEANLLDRVDVWLDFGNEPADLLDPMTETPAPVGVANINYDAKGQRQQIDYKNGASTTYDYDPLTFRLKQLLTKRKKASFPSDCQDPPPTGWPGCQVQNLNYSYDPVGNITQINDDAQQSIYFKNKRVDPSNEYTYDALYRLIKATGREHLGQGGISIPHSHNDASRIGMLTADVSRHFSPNDAKAIGTYIELYTYDAVGNFTNMQHRRTEATVPDWSRGYTYAEVSQIEDGSNAMLFKTSNRLTCTTLNQNSNNPVVETYLHDGCGNMVRMPHLGNGSLDPNMFWDYKNQLRQTEMGGGGRTYYVYDASGKRVRKIWEKAPGLTEERIYLGGFEIFRRHSGAIGTDTATLERETLHIMDDKQRIALVEKRTLDKKGDDKAPAQLIRYQLSNHLGSSSLELDHQAQIISYEEYSPYGSSTYQAVRSQTETPKRYRYAGKERDEESGLYYYGARYYASWLGRWCSADPERIGMKHVQQKNTLIMNNLFQFVDARPLVSIDPDGRDAVIIAYPEYKPEIFIEGWRPLALGHAGILLIDNKTGLTKYYEYGRYDAEEKGLTRNIKVSNVVIKDGKPTETSLKKVLSELSRETGHGGKVVGAYIKSDKFDDMNRYAQSKIKENTDPKRKEYSVSSHNCATFARDVAIEDKNIADPIIINPAPINVVDEFLEEGYPKIEYFPLTSTATKREKASTHEITVKPSTVIQKSDSQNPSHTKRKPNKVHP